MKTIAVALFIAVVSAQANAQNPATQMQGLWAMEQTFGPSARGELIVTRWQAQLGAHKTQVRRTNGGVEFDFGDDVGRFRGHFNSDSSAIQGHWIQAAHFTNGYRYGTPTRLQKRGSAWRAELQPLDDRFSIYLVMRERADTMRAFIRNPEANLWVERHFNVWLKGNELTFIGQDDSTDIVKGRYDGNAKRVYLTLKELKDREVELTPRGRDDAVGFYTRTPEPALYQYKQPAPRNDGWQTASLGEVRLDTMLIDSLVRQIIATPIRNVFSPYIHSLLIARHGKLVVEEYFFGFDANRTHDSRSLGKTFAAALVGAAQLQGAKLTSATSVLPFFKDYGATAHPDPRKEKLQLRHFMTMTSGLDCDDNEWKSLGNEGRMQEQQEQGDYWRYTLDLSMVHDPGAHYAYCSALTNMVGGVVERATKTWLPDFFYERIAEPLRFGTYHFQLTPTLTGYLGGGSYYTPRDMLKLGQLWLNGGTWNGKRIVPREFAELAVRADTAVNAPREGYHWHLNTLKAAGREWREYEGNGNGGQFVIVLPELDLVIGFTAGNYMNYGTWAKFREQLVPQFLIPAATR